MKTVYILILFLISLTSQAQNAMVDTLFSKANSLYSQNEYEEAITIYQKINSDGFVSAGLYYNLGNAYFKSNKIALAILYYEKALLLKPADKDIQHNLEYAKTFITDKIEAIPEVFYVRWYKILINLFPHDTWAIVSVTAFFLFLILLMVYLFSKNISLKKIGFFAGLFALLISLLTFIFSHQRHQIILDPGTAIIIAPTVSVKSSPDESGTDLFILHEGTKVSIEDELGNWREIEIADGSKGWMRIDDLGLI